MIGLKLYKKDIEKNLKESIAIYCKQRCIDVNDVYTTLSIEVDVSYPQVEGLYFVKLDDNTFSIKDEEIKFRMEEKYRYSKFYNDEYSAFSVHLTTIGNILVKDIFNYISNNFIADTTTVETNFNESLEERLISYKKKRLL